MKKKICVFVNYEDGSKPMRFLLGNTKVIISLYDGAQKVLVNKNGIKRRYFKSEKLLL